MAASHAAASSHAALPEIEEEEATTQRIPTLHFQMQIGEFRMTKKRLESSCFDFVSLTIIDNCHATFWFWYLQ